MRASIVLPRRPQSSARASSRACVPRAPRSWSNSYKPKWMLEDPKVNFAISTRRQPVGINHLGFQVENDEELRAQHPRRIAFESLRSRPVPRAQCRQISQGRRASVRQSRHHHATIEPGTCEGEMPAKIFESDRANRTKVKL